ncbi:BA75_01800T0 [Komagataella pastoris]|uniref:BA75_01800T0 n=1 Tax=Komagataella pastoris TaxID=4922 RepID=A0A1B2J8E0_PICPA|nr:BA75_01800T0 [Komagataella pastoris]
MVTHTIYNQLVDNNVRVEVVYENYPVIAGTEELSLILRFRYLGKPKLPKEEHSEPDPEDKHSVNSSPKAGSNETWSGFGRRISSQFSNVTRNVFLKELEKVEEQHEEEDEPVFVVGYTQLFGYLAINESIIDKKKLEDVRKKSVIGNKLAGIEGLELSDKTSNIWQFNNIEFLEPGKSNQIVPIYSTTQAMLFQEISLAEDPLKIFYVKVPLPRNLPPNYHSAAITINYKLLVGYQQFEKNGRISVRTLKFPLKLQAYVNRVGQQPFFTLDKPLLGQPIEAQVTEVTDGQKASFASIKSQLKHSDIETESDYSNDKIAVKPIEFLAFMQKLSQANINQVVDIQNEFHREFLTDYTSSKNENCRLNLINLVSNPSQVLSLRQTERKPLQKNFEELNLFEYDSLLPTKFQTRFLLKRNTKNFAQVDLDKSVFRVNDIIRINIQLLNHIRTTGLIVALERVETISDQYLFKDEKGQLYENLTEQNQLVEKVCEKVVSTFNSEQVSANLPIPYNSPSQFKTNIVNVRYLVTIKFILVEESSDLELIYSDNKGDLLRGVEFYSSGSEFLCRLPIKIVPNYEPNFGVVNYV